VKTQTIDITTESAAAPHQVWKLLSDVTTWQDWSPFQESELERPGPGDPNGVGAIRRFTRGGGRQTREEVVAFEPDRHFAYRLLSGVERVRDYRADVTLEPTAAGGTKLRWRSTFLPEVRGSGWVNRLALRYFIKKTATALATAAAR
jgi:polyketide cyclase/dehydrase/lipid transport protein